MPSIGGTATNVCPDATARDAMMLNFKVIMVPDVLATWTDAEHNAALANFYSIFGDVQTCDVCWLRWLAEKLPPRLRTRGDDCSCALQRSGGTPH